MYYSKIKVLQLEYTLHKLEKSRKLKTVQHKKSRK